MEESKIAADSQNWTDAIRLIEEALETYPDSEVLVTGLHRAKAEQVAQASLEEAKALVAAKEFVRARELLSTTADTSAYYAETRATLDQLRTIEKAEDAYVAALDAYGEGRHDRALELIRAGLEVAPDYKDLRRLESDINAFAEFLPALRGADELKLSEDVTAINEVIRTCDAVLNFRIESEAVTVMRKQAEEVKASLGARLAVIAESAFALGNDALNAGERRAALQHFNRTVEADPGNDVARYAADKIRGELGPVAKEHFQQALVHEELQQFELAIEEYEQVLQIAVPGDNYYDRAQAKLKRLRDF